LTVSHADPNARFQKYSILGTVTDPNGIPVSGASVTFRASSPAAGSPAVDRCSTDELGRYHVSQWLATPARWILAVEFRGLAPYVQSDLDLQPDEPQVIKISLRPR
jgi:Carboxypeptidase regulatory-like domain